MIEIRLPKPGPEIENATITKWESKEGDKIQIGDILAIIKTPIGSFKVAAEEQGILENILQTAGSSIDFDEPIAIMRPDLTISDFPNLAEDEDDTLPLPIGHGETDAFDMQPAETIDAGNDEEVGADVEALVNPQPGSEVETNKIYLDEQIEAESTDDLGAETQEILSEPSPELSETPALRLIPEGSEQEISQSDTSDMGLHQNNSQPKEAASDSAITESWNLENPEEIQSTLPTVEVSPAAKKMADRMGIDLGTITGTGDEGKILYIDIENAIREREALAETEAASATVLAESAVVEEEDEPVIEEDFENLGEQPELVAPDLESVEENTSEEPLSFENGIDELTTPEVTETFETDEESFSTHHQEQEREDLPDAHTQVEPADDDADGSVWQETDADEEPEEAFATDTGVALAMSDGEPALGAPQSETDASQMDSAPVYEEPAEMEVPSVQEASAIDPFVLPPDRPFPDYEEISTQFHLSKKDDLIIPFNNNKKSYSEAQLDSNRNVPHFYLLGEIDFTNGQKWLEDHNQKNSSRITLTDLMVKATGQALAMMPEMNAFVRNDRMILKRSINIGITTSVDEGVVTPVIPDVYHKSLHKVSDTVRKNIDLAIKSKVLLDYDTTFTINLLNDFGIKRVIPLITPPQTGCLAIGELQKKVVPFADFIAIRSILEVTLACDSRAIDTTNAAKFLQSIRESLESLHLNEPDPDWIKGNEQLRLI